MLQELYEIQHEQRNAWVALKYPGLNNHWMEDVVEVVVMFTWHPISEDPPRTGNYLLAHYGLITAQNFWRGRDKPWINPELLKYGWVQDQKGEDPLRFHPTHWMFVPYPSIYEVAKSENA